MVATSRPEVITAPISSSVSPLSTQNGRIIGSSAAMSNLKIKANRITAPMPGRANSSRIGSHTV